MLGNGTSRKNIPYDNMKKYATVYGCNAIYREFSPDYLVAVDTKMILEICKKQIQKSIPVWTNPNKHFAKFKGLNYFSPSKGWSSGPTALMLASDRKHDEIYILGFDYEGLNGKVNNIYADTENYKRSHDKATYYGNWLKQSIQVMQKNPEKRYIRVIENDDAFVPKEFAKLDNLQHITVDKFRKMFGI